MSLFLSQNPNLLTPLMLKHCIVIFILLGSFLMQSQTKDTINVEQDSIKKTEFIKQLGNGYFPTNYFNIDLRYLIKYNQYEGFRTGLGGITNSKFSKKYRINGYLVYGFLDHTFKYSFGGGFRIAQKTETWINLSYTDDLQETGSSNFLTDKRFFQFFEPRLLNINLFHHHVTKAIGLEHQLSNYLLSETQLAVSKIEPTYNYVYVLHGKSYTNFDISTAKIALQWSPFSVYESKDDVITQTQNGYPKFTFQYTKSFKDVLNSDFNFSKIDFRTIYKFNITPKTTTEVTLTSGIAIGNTPLTHLYHAYPNNINKETILQRFSVAGINSFETMFFNEFFSDKFTTLQLKHALKPFNISQRFKPQLVLITRYAVGNMSHIERHQNMYFNTLNKGYTESGIEINKLLFGFGLSFAYRYGAYHLPKREDNIALKFTFNIAL